MFIITKFNIMKVHKAGFAVCMTDTEIKIHSQNFNLTEPLLSQKAYSILLPWPILWKNVQKHGIEYICVLNTR